MSRVKIYMIGMGRKFIVGRASLARSSTFIRENYPFWNDEMGCTSSPLIINYGLL